MTDQFIVLARVLGLKSIEENRCRVPLDKVVRAERTEPDEAESMRTFWEHILATQERTMAEQAFTVLFDTACYVSNIIGGPVPVLLPRGDVESMNLASESGRGAALAIARSIERLVEAQSAALEQPRQERLLAKIEDVVARCGANAVPSDQRQLSTDQIAARLNLAPKTVRKLCNQGKIIARKLAGGEWRTTQQDLERSPYWQKSRRSNASLE